MKVKFGVFAETRAQYERIINITENLKAADEHILKMNKITGDIPMAYICRVRSKADIELEKPDFLVFIEDWVNPAKDVAEVVSGMSELHGMTYKQAYDNVIYFMDNASIDQRMKEQHVAQKLKVLEELDCE